MSDQDGASGLTRGQVVRRAGLLGAGLLLPSLAGASAGRAMTGRTGALLERTATDIKQLTLAVDWPGGGPPLDMTRGPGTNYEYYSLAAGLEGLLYLDNNARLRPRLASSWSNPDPETYVFQIRNGVRFWDGSPLTLDDIAYSFERHQEKAWASNWSYAFPPFASIKLNRNKNQITFKLKSPDVYFAGIAGLVPSYVVKKSFAKKHIKDIGTPSVLTMGTGPYRITKYAPDDRVELTRNEAYWGRKPAARKLVLRAIQDDDARFLAMKAGTIDGALNVPPAAADRWSSVSNARVLSYPTASCWWCAFDREVAPLGDVHVRRAMAHALDRPGLIAALFGGRARLATTMEPPETWSNLLSPAATSKLYSSLPKNQYDLQAAKQELSQSSVPKGFDITVPVPPDTTTQKILQVWQAGLAQIGVNMKLESVNADEYKARYYNRTKPVGVFITQWGTEYPDPMWNLDFLLPSKNAAAGSWNISNLKSPQLDSLLSKHQSNPNPTARGKTVSDIVRFVADDGGFFFLFWPSQVVAFNKQKTSASEFDWWAYGSSVWTSYLTPPRT